MLLVKLEDLEVQDLLLRDEILFGLFFAPNGRLNTYLCHDVRKNLLTLSVEVVYT